MKNIHTEIVVVGAGVIGLAVAARLSARFKDIIVLERHEGFGRETSSRNSEVVHACLYYPPRTLKAELCLSGNRLLYELCGQYRIPFNKCGKLVVAGSDEDCGKIAAIYEQGRACGADDIRMMSGAEAAELEPRITCRLALYSGQSGIIDVHELMRFFEKSADSQGAVIAYNCSVTGIERIGRGYAFEVEDRAAGEVLRVEAEKAVNSAGLEADAIAGLAGLDVEKLGYRLHYCKGEYFSVSHRHRNALRHLVYPAPTRYGLGVHATINLSGEMRLGPNDFYVDTLDYSVDESHGDGFFESARKFLPFMEREDIAPDTAGIRPKLQAEGGEFRDFVIRDEGDHGAPGFIDLLGIESPGLTASPAIARRVEEIMDSL